MRIHTGSRSLGALVYFAQCLLYLIQIGVVGAIMSVEYRGSAADASPAPDSAVIAPGAKLEKLASDFLFTEGPACDSEGNVFFTDQPNDRILKWSVDGKLSTYMQPCGRANGLTFDRDGNLWACADEKNELWRIAPDKKVTVVVKEYGGKLLNGPNDVWIRPDQGLYFTDP